MKTHTLGTVLAVLLAFTLSACENAPTSPSMSPTGLGSADAADAKNGPKPGRGGGAGKFLLYTHSGAWDSSGATDDGEVQSDNRNRYVGSSHPGKPALALSMPDAVATTSAWTFSAGAWDIGACWSNDATDLTTDTHVDLMRAMLQAGNIEPFFYLRVNRNRLDEAGIPLIAPGPRPTEDVQHFSVAWNRTDATMPELTQFRLFFREGVVSESPGYTKGQTDHSGGTGFTATGGWFTMQLWTSVGSGFHPAISCLNTDSLTVKATPPGS